MKNSIKYSILSGIVVLLVLSAGLARAQHVHDLHHNEMKERTKHSSDYVSSPAGIMGDHAHSMGSWMLSYMYMGMQMEGLYHGRSEINSMNLNEKYEMTPDDMFMEMHMLGAMYAIRNRVTLMAMIPLCKRRWGTRIWGITEAQ